MAALTTAESVPWRSFSCSNASRSMYITIIMERITRNLFKEPSAIDGNESEEEELTEYQCDLYYRFRTIVYEILLMIDQRSYQHEAYSRQKTREWIDVIRAQGQAYLNSYRGFECSGNDGALHNMIDWIQFGHATGEDNIKWAYNGICYRMTQQTTTDRYLEMMGVPRPKGQRCHEFDIKLDKTIDRERYDSVSKLIRDHKVLFPRPAPEQGRQFCKGMMYLVAAFDDAKLSQTEIIKKTVLVARKIDIQVEKLVDMLTRIPEVESKRRELYKAFSFVPRL